MDTQGVGSATEFLLEGPGLRTAVFKLLEDFVLE